MYEIVGGGAGVTVVVTVVPGAVVVTVGPVTVVPGAVTVVFEPVTVEVLVVVTFGRKSRSPPNPRPMPTIPAAAKAPVHFRTFLLEILSVNSFNLKKKKALGLIYPL